MFDHESHESHELVALPGIQILIQQNKDKIRAIRAISDQKKGKSFDHESRESHELVAVMKSVV